MWVKGCRWEKPAAKELLDASTVLANLRAPTECEVHKMDSVGMNDGEGFGAALRVCAGVRRMVTKLEDMASPLKR